MTIPAGYYAIPDPDNPERTTTWRVHPDGTRTPWPRNARYGPVLYRRDVPTDPEQRKATIRAYQELLTTWCRAVAEQLTADPDTAAMRFAVINIRCSRCARALRDETSKRLGIGPECRKTP